MRRGFLRLCGTSSIGLVLAACGVAPTPTATLPLPRNTATTSLVPPTLTAGVTPHLIPNPTETKTPFATATEAVIRGIVIFSADWNGELGTGWGFKGSNFVRNENVKYEFVQDPLDSSRMCMKYTVTGPSVSIPAWPPGNQYWQNSYAAWQNESNKPVSAIEVKFLYPPNFGRDIALLGGHGTKGGNDVTGILMSPERRIYVTTDDGEGKASSRKYIRTNTLIEPNKWHTLRIEYRVNKTYFLVNGAVAQIEDFTFQAIDAHAGWQYANANPDVYHAVGEWMLQKDFVVETQK